jgi:hypothetical protein
MSSFGKNKTNEPAFFAGGKTRIPRLKTRREAVFTDGFLGGSCTRMEGGMGRVSHQRTVEIILVLLGRDTQ